MSPVVACSMRRCRSSRVTRLFRELDNTHSLRSSIRLHSTNRRSSPRVAFPSFRKPTSNLRSVILLTDMRFVHKSGTCRVLLSETSVLSPVASVAKCAIPSPIVTVVVAQMRGSPAVQTPVATSIRWHLRRIRCCNRVARHLCWPPWRRKCCRVRSPRARCFCVRRSFR